MFRKVSSLRLSIITPQQNSPLPSQNKKCIAPKFPLAICLKIWYYIPTKNIYYVYNLIETTAHVTLFHEEWIKAPTSLKKIKKIMKKQKTQKIIDKAICTICVLLCILATIVCTMKTMRTGAIYGLDWRTIMWSTTIPMFIWVGTLWGKMLFSKK